MGKIFRNLQEIPVPPFAYVNTADARVFTIHRDARNHRQRTTIGQATSKSSMYPNENFKFLYPDLWKQYYGEEKQLPHELHVGLYGILLSCAWRLGLYPMLQKDFGPENTNAILDYVMYSIRYRSNSTDLMMNELADQLTFSDRLKSDSWYSDFFEHELSADLIHKFKTDWLNHYATADNLKVWLCIDGSNNDCSVSESTLSEPGKAKSLKAINIYSYIWAVSSKDGRPITWFINNGGKIDAKAFEKIITFLKASGIAVEGVIIDRGFATEDVLNLIQKLGYHYVVMLKSSSAAYKTMVKKYAETIRWNVSHVLNDKGLFGVTDRTRVFSTGEQEAYTSLFYDAIRGSRKALDDIAKVLAAQKEISAQINAGRPLSKLQIPKNMQNFLKLTGSEEAPQVELCSEALQRTVDGRGFSVIASSKDLSAGEMSTIYDFRDVSEKQFCIFKSQLASSVTRVHDDQRIQAKFAVSFIASIIRTEFEIVCHKLGLDTNKMLREVDRTVLMLMPNEEYLAVHDYSSRIKSLYSQFGLTNEHMDYFALEINNRRNPMHSQTREIPPFIEPKPRRRPGRPAKHTSTEAEKKPKRKPGRPKGSKNKKTLEREAVAANMPPQPKRKPGRPKGSRNKKTLELEARAAAPKRGRGRPKGSKNKKTLEREALAASRPRRTEHKPTRPRYSRNMEMPGRETVVVPRERQSLSKGQDEQKNREAVSELAKLKYSRPEKGQSE